MDVKRLFKSAPPKKPIKRLDDIVKDWQFRFGESGINARQRDQVVEFCRQAKTFTQAVQRACASRCSAGKMHNHQSRVREVDRQFFANNILKSEADECQNFDDLHDLIESIAQHGIGPVTIYDVATRIGAFLGLEPESLYLHAGVRLGLAKLTGRRASADKRIPLKSLPAALHGLPADEVEDLLCTYRSILHPGLLSGKQVEDR